MSHASQPHPDTLKGKRVLIIGGTSGIGKGVTSAALFAGAKVFLSSSDPSKVSSTTTEFQSTYPGAAVSGIAADLSVPETIEAKLEKILQTAVAQLGGPLDHIVYTAGDAFDRSPLSALTAGNAYSSWTVRYLGPLLIGKLVNVNPGVYMTQVASSSITLTSGILGSKPSPGLSKIIGCCGAIETLGKGLAVDAAPVRVNVVAPGAIRTPMLEKLGEEGMARFSKQQLIHKVGEPHDIAEAYLFSMRCGFLTGQLFAIDGGYTYK